MNMKVIQGAFGHQAPTNLASDLRALADAVDRGEIKELITAYIQEDQYTFLFAASLQTSLVLSTLMQDTAINNLRE